MELSKAVRCCRQDDVFCEDVTFAQFAVLDAVAGSRSLNMANLHDVLSVNKSTTTRLVAPLIKKNLLIREKAEHDSRAATLRLTKQGKEVHEKVWKCLLSFVRAVQEEIPEGKRDSALAGAATFLAALRNVSSMRCVGESDACSCRCA